MPVVIRASNSSSSRAICSSKMEGSTTAAAPASSSLRMLSSFELSGLALATSGFFSVMPR